MGLLLLAFTLLIAAGLTYFTVHGYMGWWFWSSGSVAVQAAQICESMSAIGIIVNRPVRMARVTEWSLSLDGDSS